MTRRWFAIGLAVSCCVLGSCKTVVTTPTADSARNDPPASPLNKPAGETQSSWVRSATVALGGVPFDNASLPIISPDGRFVATQVGIAPTWPTIIAAPEAEVPSLTHIEVYQLDRRSTVGDAQRNAPRLMFTLAEPALLGRSCDNDGFLIESPRENGARWIGHVSWTTGDTLWLIDDDHVNAFATAGPDGRLAWSRRAIEAEHFELAVRLGDKMWTQPTAAPGVDWLMPTWSGRGDGLFVLRLQDAVLELAFANADSSEAFRLSLKTYPLGPDANVSTAFQALAGQVNVIDGQIPRRDQLLYDHPTLGRIALWRPMAGAGRTAMYLNPDSFMALMIDDDTALVSTEKEVLRQRLSNARDKSRLAEGSQALRATPACEFEWTLLEPSEGYVGLRGLRLLPVNATAGGR